MNRRHLLVLTGAGFASIAVACGQDAEKTPTKTDSKRTKSGGTGCDATVDAQSKQMRKSLQYVEKSPKPDSKCNNCTQYEADKFGECGGCKLFSGPVQPEGYCLSWAAKDEAAPSGSSTAG